MREIRFRLLLTQEQLAQEAGISRPELSAWENDRRAPRPAALDRLLAAIQSPEFAYPVLPITSQEAEELRQLAPPWYGRKRTR